MTEAKSQAQKFEEVYVNVMALYCALKDIGQFKIRRAKMVSGEVPAEAIDFIADVEIKAKRANINAISWHRILQYPETYLELNKEDKRALGKVFKCGQLDVSGPYKKLYFKAKNQRG